MSTFRPQVLSWIDICAGLAAKTVARGPVVTASVDSVHFIRPVRKGSVAIIAAMVNRTFKSSMEVLLREMSAWTLLSLSHLGVAHGGDQVLTMRWASFFAVLRYGQHAADGALVHHLWQCCLTSTICLTLVHVKGRRCQPLQPCQACCFA